MKHWLALAALICFGSTAAQAAVETFDVQYSSVNYKMVTVSTYVVTALFSGTLQGAVTSFYDIQPNRRVLSIQNVDPSTTTFATCVLDVSSTNVLGYLAANQIEYTIAPSSSPLAGQVIPPAGFAPTNSWLPKTALTNATGQYFIPWCLCYSPSSFKASACKLLVTQYGGY